MCPFLTWQTPPPTRWKPSHRRTEPAQRVVGTAQGELATLTPKSIDLAAKKITVGAEDTKNGKEANLPLPKVMVADIKKWLAGKRGPLFPDLAKKDAAKMIRRDLEALSIPDKTGIGERCFHAATRNTYISRLFDAGPAAGADSAVRPAWRHPGDDQVRQAQGGRG
jgi:integrase